MKISKDANINYLAKIVRLNNIIAVPNSDNLVMTTIDGNVIVMNKEGVETGKIMVYFPAESCISEWYLSEHNLLREKEFNSDKEKSGFFERNGRVRCIKLRGQISAGFLMPFETLGISFNESLINIEFDTINDKLIVKKYTIKNLRTPGTPNSKERKNKGKVTSKVIENQFRFHIDTPQLVKNIGRFTMDSVINITRKVHGTSGISAYVLCNKDNPWHSRFAAWTWNNVWNRMINIFAKEPWEFKLNDTTYDYLYSSRRVVKNDREDSGFYKVDIWKYADDIIKPKLLKGMTMYYEIVGYLPDGKMIQKDYPYGMKHPHKTNSYEYGVNFDIHVYRITMTTADGAVIEWNTQMVNQYCERVGLKPVETYFEGTVREFLKSNVHSPLDTKYNGLMKDNDEVNTIDVLESLGEIDMLKERFVNKLAATYLEHNALDCGKNIPDEGIVVRLEIFDLDVYKFKSRRFLFKETEELDSGEANIEG